MPHLSPSARRAGAALALLSSALLGCAGSEADDGFGGKADDFAGTSRCLDKVSALAEGPARNLTGFSLVVDAGQGGRMSAFALTGDRVGLELPGGPRVIAGGQLAITYIDGLNDLESPDPVVVGFKVHGVDHVREMTSKIDFGHRFAEATITLPRPGQGPTTDDDRVQIWFQRATPAGTEFDSRGGANYVAELVPPIHTTMCFGPDFEQTFDSPPIAATSIKLAYDPGRLLSQMQRELGFIQSWDIAARLRAFDADEGELATTATPITKGILIAGEDEFDIVNAIMPVAIPAGAARVELWFEGTADGKRFFDSNLGGNYQVDVN